MNPSLINVRLGERRINMFKKYRNIERLKAKNTEYFHPGDMITITEKIDGANSGISYDAETDSIIPQSHNNALNPMNTLRGFYEFVNRLDKNKIKEVVGNTKILYGEWNVSHTVPYPDDTRNKFYVFDIFDTETETYDNDYDHLKEVADYLDVNIVPLFYKGEFLSWEHCMSFVGKTDLGGEYGEGVVVKSGNTSIKIVGEKFKEVADRKKEKTLTPEQLEILAKKKELVESIVTKARVAKLLNKFVDENILPEDWCEQDMSIVAKNLPRRCYDDCLKEEPEVVTTIDDFGKMCAKAAMGLAKEILEERNKV